MSQAPQHVLRRLFDIAVEVADPMRSVPLHLPPKPDGPVYVIGAGKASARMAEALEAAWGPTPGFVITRYGYARPCQGIEIVEANHPTPDAAGVAATETLLAKIAGLSEDTTVIALISGGASALLVAPGPSLTLDDKKRINADLLASGAPIDQMNIVRKHLSRVKGGQLAAAVHPRPLRALMISDVPGDDPAYIGSGPTVGDPSAPRAARSILERLNINITFEMDHALGQSGVLPPDDPAFSTTTHTIIAAPSQSLDAAAEAAKTDGIEPQILGDAIEGEARDVAAAHAAQALTVQADMKPGDAPKLLLSGGELTVTRRGDGVGGPNAEYALALALALDGAPGICAIACDTDGVDGAAEVAGAIISPDTLARAKSIGIDAAHALEINDAHSFFASIDAQVIPGPTLTNVNDFRAILIAPPTP